MFVAHRNLKPIMASLPFLSRMVGTSGVSIRARVFGGFGIVLLLLAAVVAVAKVSVIVISTKAGLSRMLPVFLLR